MSILNIGNGNISDHAIHGVGESDLIKLYQSHSFAFVTDENDNRSGQFTLVDILSD